MRKLPTGQTKRGEPMLLRNRVRGIAIPAFVIAAAMMGGGQDPATAGDETRSKGVEAVYKSKGEIVWVRHCIVCHGADGKGNTDAAQEISPAPKDLTDPLNVTWAFKKDWLRLRIAEGVPGTAMPAWEKVLTPPEIEAVTEYVQRLSGADKITETQAHAAQIERGQRLYRARCSVCHGVDGKARTQVAGAVEPPPQNLTDPKVVARLTTAGIAQVVTDGRGGTVMPAWGRVLDAQQIRDVAAYVRQEIQKKTD